VPPRSGLRTGWQLWFSSKKVVMIVGGTRVLKVGGGGGGGGKGQDTPARRTIHAGILGDRENYKTLNPTCFEKHRSQVAEACMLAAGEEAVHHHGQLRGVQRPDRPVQAEQAAPDVRVRHGGLPGGPGHRRAQQHPGDSLQGVPSNSPLTAGNLGTTMCNVSSRHSDGLPSCWPGVVGGWEGEGGGEQQSRTPKPLSRVI